MGSPGRPVVPRAGSELPESRPGKEVRPLSHQENFKELLAEAITDEIAAVSMYSRMATMVEDPVLRTVLLSIAGDEYQHAKIFTTWLQLDPAPAATR